ncbi:PQQ-dependent sugar dehydrogenase [Dokdonella sp.]|uniref:PQQ-dependent sugar dehydrogenase n=1 Tax=Dokdonella sp. TaxID=2291710 RepID=UPI00262C6527|nr:PQQ-dependent sugar dehydrogenase [Dokdonella sp.]
MQRLALITAALAMNACAAKSTPQVPLDTLVLPPGFRIALYATGVEGARQLALGAKGTVFAGTRDAGKVYAISDTDGDGRADKVRTIASGLQLPSGIAFRDGDLYVGAVSRILALRGIEDRLDDPPKPEVVTDKLPDKVHHGWKFIAFGPDGRLYVPVGAPCNICAEDRNFAKILSMKPDGSDWRDEAFGVRNTVGFDWQPGTRELWFTDNGRDLLGDDLPSDELDRVTRRGEHFGFPYCHQGDTPDPEFAAGRSCSEFTPPVSNLGAHVAAIGMRFYTGAMFPAEYRNAAIIAEHGSWNRTKKSGYRVVAVELDGAKVTKQQVLVDGFQRDEVAYGRPADVLVMPDGALLVSDEYAGAIYRITYAAPAAKKE